MRVTFDEDDEDALLGQAVAGARAARRTREPAGLMISNTPGPPSRAAHTMGPCA
jgi:hypothetical protein